MRFRKWAIVSLAIAVSIPALVAVGCSSFSSDTPDDTDKDDGAQPDTSSTPDGEGRDAAADADADARGPRIRCNGNGADDGCSVGAEVCCIASNFNIKLHNWSCKDAGPGGCPTVYIAAPCDDSDDCAALGLPGAVCCATYKGDDASAFSFTRVECIARDNCRNLPNSWVMCDPTRTDPVCDGGVCTSLGGGFAHCD